MYQLARLNKRSALSAATLTLLSVGGLALMGCGEPKEPQFPPEDNGSPTEEAADESWDTGGPKASTADAEKPEAAKPRTPVAPEFTPGMSVDQAISAVSSDYEFVGLEPDLLGKPLRDINTYSDCKVSPASHFTVRIAVWDGRVVGVDVKAPSKQLAECIDGVVRGLSYNEKVLSINTVVYSF